MIPEAQKQQMAEAVAKIRETMAAAARAAGRDPADVRLCAACKTRTVEEVRYSADLPIDLFGENHVQELVEKTDAGAYNGKPGHFIGHLQTNKVNKVVGRAALIQSVDSTRLLDKIDAAAARLGLVQDILVEINIGEEASKSGVDANSLFPLLEAAAARENTRLRGLMAIPPADVFGVEWAWGNSSFRGNLYDKWVVGGWLRAGHCGAAKQTGGSHHVIVRRSWALPILMMLPSVRGHSVVIFSPLTFVPLELLRFTSTTSPPRRQRSHWWREIEGS